MKDLKEYNRIHYWIRSNYGKAIRCDFETTCTNKSKTFEWALKKGFDYEKKINNYYQLCKSCHTKYDYKGGRTMSDVNRKKMSDRMKGVPPVNKGSDSKINKSCKFCKSVYRAYEAKRKTYCSVKCRNEDMIGKPTRNKTGRGGKDAA